MFRRIRSISMPITTNCRCNRRVSIKREDKDSTNVTNILASVTTSTDNEHEVSIKREDVDFTNTRSSLATSTDGNEATDEKKASQSDDEEQVIIKTEEPQTDAEILAALPESNLSKRSTTEKTHLRGFPRGNNRKSSLQATSKSARVQKNKKWDRTPTMIRLVRRHKIVHISDRGEVRGHVRFGTEEWTLDEVWRTEAQARWVASRSECQTTG